MRHPLGPLGARERLQPKSNVLRRAQMRKQRMLLKHHAHAPPLGRHVHRGGRQQLIPQPDVPGLHRLEPGNGSQHRGFATAGRPQQSHRLPSRHVQGKILHHRLPRIRRAHAAICAIRYAQLVDMQRNRCGRRSMRQCVCICLRRV